MPEPTGPTEPTGSTEPTAPTGPTEYLERRAHEALAHDPRVQELDLRVHVEGGHERLLVSGCVATRERRDAVTDVLAELLPGVAVVNEVEVMQLGNRPDEEAVDR